MCTVTVAADARQIEARLVQKSQSCPCCSGELPGRFQERLAVNRMLVTDTENVPRYGQAVPARHSRRVVLTWHTHR